MHSCAVNIPWSGGVEDETLRDIAAMTGATLVDDEFTVKLSELELQHFGSAKQVQIDASFTHIVGGSFNLEALDKRFEEIKLTIAEAETANMRKIHQERLARMQK